MPSSKHASVPSAKRLIFNPLLSSIKEVKAFLLSEAVGTGHVFNRCLYIHTGGGHCAKVDFTQKPTSFFTDSTSLNLLGDVLTDRMQLFKGDLEDIVNYSVLSLTDPVMEVPLIPGKILFFALSVSNRPSYYDLAVGNATGNTLCYNAHTSAAISGLWHSGDRGAGASVLLHSLRMEETLKDNPFVLFVSGYQKSALHRYREQNPAVLIVNHHTRSVYLVPIPLDEASIGNATVCCPAVGTRVGDVVRFAVLPNPPVQEDIQVSSHSLQAAIPTFRDAIATATTILAQTLVSVSPAAHPAITAVSSSSSGGAAVSTSAPDDLHPGLLAVVERGLTLVESCKPTHVLQFGCGISVDTVFEVKEKDEAVLPCCLGNVLEGSRILLLGRPYTGTVPASSFSHMAAGSRTAVVTVSDTMLDQARLQNPHRRINALFIVVPTKAYDEAILDKPTEREAYLTDLNINAVTALAGAQSVVVVQLRDNYFFYRGIRWHGLLEERPAFGADVTDMVHHFQEWQETATLPWPLLTSIRDDTDVYFGRDARLTIARAAELFAAMTLDDLLERKEDIQDVLYQMQILLGAEEIASFAGTLITSLTAKLLAAVTVHKKPYVAFLLTARAPAVDELEEKSRLAVKTKLLTTYKHAERAAKESCQWLIDALGSLVSTRASSTKRHDLNQLHRKTLVAGNLAEAKKMTFAQLQAILEEKCSEVGVVVGEVSTEALPILLAGVAAGKLMDLEPANLYAAIRDSECRPALDVLTLLPEVADTHNGPLTPAKQVETPPWVLPYGAEQQHSALPWPLFDEFVQLDDPRNVYWLGKCNEPHIAQLRILARGCIASSRISRDYGITPAMRDLGFLLVVFLVDMMRATAATMTPGEGDAERAKVMRALYGLLLSTLASGSGKPLSMAWQLVLANSDLELPPASEWWLYAELVRLLPYTAWPTTTVHANVRKLLVRTLRKRLTDPATDRMRKAVHEMKKDTADAALADRNRQLRFLQVAVKVIHHLHTQQPAPEEVRGIAARTLTLQPPGVRSDGGYGLVLHFLESLAATGTASPAETERTKQACLSMYTKRSARYKKAKDLIHKYSKRDDAGKAAELAELLAQDMENLSAAWDGHHVKVQNVQAFLEVRDGISDEEVMRMSGDAERRRIPWQVWTGEPIPKEEVEANVEFVLGREMEVKKQDETEQLTVAAPKKLAQTLADQLQCVKHSDKAVKLAKGLDKTVIQELAVSCDIPGDVLLQLCAMVGYEDSAKATQFLRNTVSTLLQQWRDPMVGEQEAVRNALE